MKTEDGIHRMARIYLDFQSMKRNDPGAGNVYVRLYQGQSVPRFMRMAVSEDVS